MAVILLGCRGFEENVGRTYWLAPFGSKADIQEKGERFKSLS